MAKANSDDAFNFPPYDQLTKSFEIGGLNYQELQTKEETLLKKSLDGISFYYLRLEDYSWNKFIENNLVSIDSHPLDDAVWNTQQLVN
jgi:hypothetical protein